MTSTGVTSSTTGSRTYTHAGGWFWSSATGSGQCGTTDGSGQEPWKVLRRVVGDLGTLESLVGVTVTRGVQGPSEGKSGVTQEKALRLLSDTGTLRDSWGKFYNGPVVSGFSGVTLDLFEILGTLGVLLTSWGDGGVAWYGLDDSGTLRGVVLLGDSRRLGRWFRGSSGNPG